MAGFLYFLPGGGNRNNFDEFGLGHIKALSLAANSVSNGPGNQSGTLFGGKYDPDTQAWTRHGKFWLGYSKDAPPTPEDLARPEQVVGHTVNLEGFELMVPLARRFPQGTELPQAIVLGENGELFTESLPRFVKVSAGAERIFNALVLGDGEVGAKETWDIIVSALAVNYQISAAELTALHIITTSNVRKIAEALIDWPAILEWEKAELQKKSAQEESNTNSGDPV